jgi:hypothetical protein
MSKTVKEILKQVVKSKEKSNPENNPKKIQFEELPTSVQEIIMTCNWNFHFVSKSSPLSEIIEVHPHSIHPNFEVYKISLVGESITRDEPFLPYVSENKTTSYSLYYNEATAKVMTEREFTESVINMSANRFKLTTDHN